MRVRLDNGTLASGTALPALQIIYYFAQGRHQWVVELAQLEEIDRFLGVQVPDLRPTLLALAQKSWTNSVAYPGATQDQRIVEIYESSAVQAADELGEPGAVIVEDLMSDRTFLDFVLWVLGAVDVSEAIERGWLRIVHAGGGGRVIDVAIDRSRRFAETPARVAAILDSDRMNPGETTAAHEKARVLSSNHSLQVIVLEFREAENYIPNRALATIQPSRHTSKRLRSLKRLTPEQRAHYDFKHGFRTNGVPSSQEDLFRGVSSTIIRHLGDGFGKRVIECLISARAGLTDKDVRSLGGNAENEFHRILELLRSLI